MFSGIVEEIGVVEAVTPRGGGVRLRVAAEHVSRGVRPGDSVAIDGVCQTVVAHDPAGFEVEAIATTLSRTTLGRLTPGSRVNLERAVALGERLGGHLVQGHVDGTGEVTAVEPAGEHVLLDIELPDMVAEVTVLHGSIAVQGVSLTVNALPDPDTAQVAIIPHTWQHTNLRDLRPGDRVNIEGDMLGRFVVSYLRRLERLPGER